jgi:hypothetical protein
MRTDIVDAVADAAKLKGRQVWCLECGHTERVENGLANGWPKCCGFTMTIDHPETRKR